MPILDALKDVSEIIPAANGAVGSAQCDAILLAYVSALAGEFAKSTGQTTLDLKTAFAAARENLTTGAWLCGMSETLSTAGRDALDRLAAQFAP